MNGILAWLTAFFVALVPGTQPHPGWDGYLEADFVYVAPVSAGVIDTIKVAEGDTVRKGDVLFIQSTDQYKASLDAAEAKAAAARANLENLSTGSRADEITVVRAQLNKARADLSLAQTSYNRSVKLHEQGFAPQSRVDQDKTALDSAQAQVDQLQAQLQLAQLPTGRDAQRSGAEADLKAAEAQAEQARVQLKDRTLTAPVDGQIERVFYQQGETAGVGAPVVSILPPRALKARFFVPETQRAELRIGETLKVTCDGCKAGLTASLTYVASEPEHTPPVIFSRDERARLVFMVEARMNERSGLLPGQPVRVEAAP